MSSRARPRRRLAWLLAVPPLLAAGGIGASAVVRSLAVAGPRSIGELTLRATAGAGGASGVLEQLEAFRLSVRRRAGAAGVGRPFSFAATATMPVDSTSAGELLAATLQSTIYGSGDVALRTAHAAGITYELGHVAVTAHVVEEAGGKAAVRAALSIGRLSVLQATTPPPTTVTTAAPTTVTTAAPASTTTAAPAGTTTAAPTTAPVTTATTSPPTTSPSSTTAPTSTVAVSTTTVPFTGTTANLQAVSFPTSGPGAGEDGWIVGDAGTILHTADGGAHWDVESSGTSQALLAVYFADTTHGWAVGEGGVILATADGGTTWALQTIPGQVCAGFPDCDWLQGVVFANDSDGVIVGTNETVLDTTDGGATWHYVQGIAPGTSIPPGSYFYSFDSVALSPAGAVAVGNAASASESAIFSSPSPYSTSDTWTEVTSPTASALRAVSFLGGGNDGYAVGLSGTVLASSDGGTSWSSVGAPSSSDLFALATGGSCGTGASCAIAAGAKGTEEAEVNGRWSSFPSGAGTNLNGVAVLAPNAAGFVAVGDGGTIVAGSYLA